MRVLVEIIKKLLIKLGLFEGVCEMFLYSFECI